MATLQDIAQPLVVDGEQTLWIKEPAYVTGGRVVVANDAEDTAAALSITPQGVAAIELKDAEAFVVRNKKYTAPGAFTETLPLQVTRDGRVLFNAPGLVADTDTRVAQDEVTVFGGLKADRLRATTLDVEEITSLNLRFVKAIEQISDRIVVTHEDDTVSELPVGWDTIKNKPDTFPVDRQLSEAVPYLTNRVQLAQFNVDFLLGEVVRLQAEVDSLDRLTVNDTTTFGPALVPAAIVDAIRSKIDGGLASVRAPIV